MECDCFVCQNYEVVEIRDCPRCEFVNAPLTTEGICLNCTLIERNDEGSD